MLKCKILQKLLSVDDMCRQNDQPEVAVLSETSQWGNLRKGDSANEAYQ
jgi:hypothetical protein